MFTETLYYQCYPYLTDENEDLRGKIICSGHIKTKSGLEF